jgi:hypothetical protein
MKPLLAVPLLMLATLSTAHGQPAFTAREGQVDFVTPSGNIGCIYTPAGGTSWYQTADGGPELACDRVMPTYIRLVLTGAGAATEIADVGDQGCCGAENVLAYGQQVVLGPFTCTAETHGLTCTRADGHGFLVSRAVSEAY